MNTTNLPVRPEATTFVTQVRGHLADLSEDEQLDLTEGMESDLSDQIAEGHELGDPEAYARELRAAAGFDPVMARSRTPKWRGLRGTVPMSRSAWDRWVQHPRIRDAWAVLSVLQPAWWLLRGWAVAVLICRAFPGWYTGGWVWLPGIHPMLGLLAFFGCGLLSVLIGMGRIWPGKQRVQKADSDRFVLALGNLTAVVLLVCAPFLVGDGLRDRIGNEVWDGPGAVGVSGVSLNGGRVCNIFAYNQNGKPLKGVQLYDQAGEPLAVRCAGQGDWKVPWMYDGVARWNVYPLAMRDRPALTRAERLDTTGAKFPPPRREKDLRVVHPLDAGNAVSHAGAGPSDKKSGKKDRQLPKPGGAARP